MNITKDLQLTSVRFHLKGHSLEETSELFEVPVELLSEWVERYMHGDYFISATLKKPVKRLELDFAKIREIVRENPKISKKELCLQYGCSGNYVDRILRTEGKAWTRFKREIMKEIDEEKRK